MLTSKVAKRYAQGLLDFTQESGNTASVFGEMKDVVKIVNDSKELRNFFASPIIDAKKKEKAAKEIFSKFSPVSQNLITLVIKQGRESHLQDIAQEIALNLDRFLKHSVEAKPHPWTLCRGLKT